jgi:CHASE3 domain sensor protein
MIAGVKKIPILRYALIVLLIVVLFGSAFYLYLQYNKAEKLRSNFQQMVNARANSALIDSCIIELYSADNSSRMYALTGRKWYFNEFSRQIKNVRGVITTINTNNKSTAGTSDNNTLSDLVSQKTIKTDTYIRLMTLSDSLMRSAKKINAALKDQSNKVIMQPVIRRIKPKPILIPLRLLLKYPNRRRNFSAACFRFLAKKISSR